MQDITPPIPNFDHLGDEGLKLVSYCPVCHSKYNPLEAKVVDESSSAHLLHVKCRRCHSAILALILINHFGVSSIGLITDLDGQEIGKFKEAEIVSDSDVLDVYQILNDENGVEKLLQ